ncbi:MAG: TetR/AcrR family transcriptional regulator [Variibacter sp.]|nr:TetR/AcrR family transcriptional regulator [Variibacter sp.]
MPRTAKRPKTAPRQRALDPMPGRRAPAAQSKSARAADGASAGPNRQADIIEVAAECFARKGYDATTMRDIAARVKMLAGSIYYHFPSKEELLIAVHQEAVQRIRDKVAAAVDPAADPWTRLLQACSAYLQALNRERKFALVVITEFPRRRSDRIRAKLVAHREELEQVFRELVADLPLAPRVDRSFWRLALLSIMAWTMVWYRKGGKSPQQIATEMVAMLRDRTAA